MINGPVSQGWACMGSGLLLARLLFRSSNFQDIYGGAMSADLYYRKDV